MTIVVHEAVRDAHAHVGAAAHCELTIVLESQ